jgi:hypothetical protein
MEGITSPFLKIDKLRVQPRRLFIRRFSIATQLRTSSIHALYRDMSMGASHFQPIHVHTIISHQARNKSIEIYRRPAVVNEVRARSHLSNEENRLHVPFRSEGQILRVGNRSQTPRFPNNERTQTTLQVGGSTDGLINEPLPLLLLHGRICLTHTATRPPADSRRRTDAAHTPTEVSQASARSSRHDDEAPRSYLTSTRLPTRHCNPRTCVGSPPSSRPPPHQLRTTLPPLMGF